MMKPKGQLNIDETTIIIIISYTVKNNNNNKKKQYSAQNIPENLNLKKSKYIDTQQWQHIYFSWH